MTQAVSPNCTITKGLMSLLFPENMCTIQPLVRSTVHWLPVPSLYRTCKLDRKRITWVLQHLPPWYVLTWRSPPSHVLACKHAPVMCPELHFHQLRCIQCHSVLSQYHCMSVPITHACSGIHLCQMVHIYHHTWMVWEQFLLMFLPPNFSSTYNSHCETS